MKNALQLIGNDIINGQGKFPMKVKSYGFSEEEVANDIENEIINQIDNVNINGELIPYDYKKEPFKKPENKKVIINENPVKPKTPIRDLKKEISKNNLEETLLLEQEREYDIIDRRLIEELNLRCKNLEKKFENILKTYYNKEQIYINLEKMKKEYENLLYQKSKDKNLLLAQKQNLENDISNLTIALSNAKKEIIRLKEIKSKSLDKYNTIKEDLDNKLEEKKISHISLKSTLAFIENQIYDLTGEDEKINENNKKIETLVNDENNIQNKQMKKENNKLINDIEKLKKIIKDSQDEIISLKKKIKKKGENNILMREVIKFKDKKNNFQDNNIKGLILDIEKRNQSAHWENYCILLKNNQLNDYKKSKH